MRKLLLAAIALSASLILNAQTLTINTFVGGGPNNVSAGLPGLGFLSAIVPDGSGNFYIAASEAHRVFRVSSGGILTVYAGSGKAGYSGDGGAATSASLNAPLGLAVDSAGNLYIADTGNHCIRKVTTAGVVTTFAGIGTTTGSTGDGGAATSARLASPRGVAVDSTGIVYIADTGNNRVRAVGLGGQINNFAGTGTAGFTCDGCDAGTSQLNGPSSVAVNAAGDVFIADTTNNRIRRVILSTNLITTIAGTGTAAFNGSGPALGTTLNLGGPRSIAIDPTGILYVADTGIHVIRKLVANNATVPPTYTMSVIAGVPNTAGNNGDGIATTSQLNGPTGVGVDGTTVYIADTVNRLARSVTGTTLTTRAGSGQAVTTDFGTGLSATSGRLVLPRGLAIDSAGNTFISEFSSGLVKRVDAVTGILTKFAGTGTTGAATGNGGPATSAVLGARLRGLATDTTGNLYISDEANNVIRRVDKNSGIITSLTLTNVPAGKTVIPNSLAFDPQGRLLVGDDVNCIVWRIDLSSGNDTTRYAGTLDGCTGVQAGDGGPATSARFLWVYGISVDSLGNLYIANRTSHTVRRVDAQTRIITLFAGTGTAGISGDQGPATAARVNEPWATSTDASNNVFIADSGNNRIRKVDVSTGNITTVAGSNVNGFGGDGGPATNAALSFPTFVARGSDGRVIFTDENNERVRTLTNCTFTLATSSTTIPAAALANGTVGLTGTSGCAWTATSNAAHLAVTTASGSGSATVGFTATANTSAAQRSGTLTIAGQTFTVNQSGVTCGFTLGSSSSTPGNAAGTGSVSFTATASDCAWTAVSNAAFITLTSAAAGNGSGSVNFSFTANATGSARTGTITVGGQTYTVTQSGVGCTFTLGSSSSTPSAAAGTGNVTFTATASDCAWTAVSNAAFITLTSAAAGNGSGSVNFSFTANASGSARTGTLTVAGQTYTVTQSGAGCNFTLGSSSSAPSAAAGTGSVAFTASASDCAWTAVSNSPFITLTSAAAGNGSGSVNFSFTANAGAARSGTITVGGQTYTVNQAAAVATCSFTLDNASTSQTQVGGSLNVNFASSIPGCAWTVTSNAAFVTLGGPATGNGNGTIVLIVAPNFGLTSRSGTVTIAGQTFTVNQIAANCAYGLSTSNLSVPANGQTANVTLTATGANCAWASEPDASFVQIFPASGVAGSTSIAYTVFPNFTPRARTATVKIGTATLNVSQAASSLNANERFVSLAYFSFLGRLPSAAELAGQVSALNTGTARQDMALGFFNSLEFNLAGRFIAGLYVGLLNRDAEYGGWLFQRNAYATGFIDQNTAVANFINSAEFQLSGVLSNDNFVRLLYRQILLREAGAAEVVFQSNALATGTTRVQLASNFLNSTEFRISTGPRLTTFLLHACLLQRDPTSTERTAMIAQVSGGTAVRDLMTTIINSIEFQGIVN